MTLNLVGVKFGELTVQSKVGSRYISTSKIYKTFWNCICLCGKTSEKTTDALRSGKTQSCGCCEWHIHHREAYVTWMGMKQRCNDPGCKDYKYYGAIGRTYDPRWEKFTEFWKDMGDPPKDLRTGERLSLDRKDNDGNYSKDNCQWADRSQQQGNRTIIRQGR